MARQSRGMALKCPMCSASVAYVRGDPLPPAFPFCGERCKMLDLDNWFSERYVVGRELTDEEQATADVTDMSRDDLVGLVRELQERLGETVEADEDDGIEV